jgi:hypothetical protein
MSSAPPLLLLAPSTRLWYWHCDHPWNAQTCATWPVACARLPSQLHRVINHQPPSTPKLSIMSTPLIPAAASVGSAQPTAAQLALFPQRADELRLFLLDLPATRSVMLSVAEDLCNIAFRLVHEDKSIVIFASAHGCGYQEAPVRAGPCIALRRPTDHEEQAMALLAVPPIAARDLQVLSDVSAMIRTRCRDPTMSGEFPVCLSTVSVPYDHTTILDGFFFFKQ